MEDNLLTAKGLGAALGVAEATIRQWQSYADPPPPSLRVGRLRRYRFSEVVGWLRAGHADGVSKRIRERREKRSETVRMASAAATGGPSAAGLAATPTGNHSTPRGAES